MKEKDLFIKSIETLLNSWGSDTPDEVIWGLNEMLDWFEKEYNVQLNIRFMESREMFDENLEETEGGDYVDPYEKVIEKIRSLKK